MLAAFGRVLKGESMASVRALVVRAIVAALAARPPRLWPLTRLRPHSPVQTRPRISGVSIDLDVVARQLDVARQQIQPSLGASVYDFSPQALQVIPQGENAPLNQVLLQAPGVAQDSFGQIHLRGEHANVQYRLNGVELPEGLSVFGQALDRASPTACR